MLGAPLEKNILGPALDK